MSPLLKIRAERDQMSAIERRIADYMLENAHLLRDYSSQQLANALGISQSSVVKFSQKLGFKGYPDLKFSIGEAVARGRDGVQERRARAEAAEHPHAALAEDLWRAKSRAEEETRLINPPARSTRWPRPSAAPAASSSSGSAKTAFPRAAFAMKLSLLGIRPCTTSTRC